MRVLRIHGSSSEFTVGKVESLGPTMAFSFIIFPCHEVKDLLYPTNLLINTADLKQELLEVANLP